MSDPNFWRNRPVTIERLRDIAAKARARGPGWVGRRVLKELRQPETTQGVALRRLNMALASAALWLLSLLPALGFRLVGPRRRSLGLFLDLDVTSLTFDNLDSLVLAEMERRRLGLDSVHVVIVPGRAGGMREETAHYAAAVNAEARRWRVDNLVVPLFALMPSCAGYTICSDRRHAYMVRMLFPRCVLPRGYWPAFPSMTLRQQVFAAAQAGQPVFPAIRVPEQAMRYVRAWLEARVQGRRPVVITLRQYGYEASRNSNVAAWVEFGRRLDPAKYLPVFVQDLDTAMGLPPPEMEGLLIFREAPFNMLLRAALYEQAWLNICQMHGPTELMWYNERVRYVAFVTVGSSTETTDEFLRAYGMEPGKSPPFATPLQKWAWRKDDLEEIEDEFRTMAAAIERAEAAGPPAARGG